MNGLIRWLIPVVLTFCVAGRARGADPVQPPAGAANCIACHASDGNKPVSPETPRLAGQEHAYLAHALRQYRDGERQNPVMGAMAKALSDAQVESLARYFAAQSGLSVKY